MEVLQRFRQLTKEGKRGEYKDGQIVFGEESFPASTSVPLKNLDGSELTLVTIWHLVKASDTSLSHSEYVMDAKKSGIPNVAIVIRQDLTNYVTGGSNSCQHLIEVAKLPPSQLVKRRRVEEWTVEDVIDEEVVLTARNSVMSNDNVSIDLRAITHIINDTGLRTLVNAKPAATTSSKSASGKPVKPLAPNPDAHIPIIIVPASRSALINLRNSGDFFQNNNFIDANSAADQFKVLPSKSNPHLVRIQIPSINQPHKKSEFHLMDNTEKLSSEQWKRVVCIIVTGQTWQLDKFPPALFGKSTPSEIFEKIMGFYMYMEGDIINANVLKWNVKRVELSRNKRYNDAVVATAFWKDVHNYLKSKANQLKLAF